MIRKQVLQCSLGFIVLVSSVAAFGQTPTVIHYRGHLDVPSVVPAGTVQRELTFSLYEMYSGGSPIWSETQILDIYDGNFAAVLGSVNSVTPELFTGEYRYLGVQVGADPELTPRQRIAAVPYAFQAVNAEKAADADTLGGGQVRTSTQGVHIEPESQSETVWVSGGINATGSLSCDEGMHVGDFAQFDYGACFGTREPIADYFIHIEKRQSEDFPSFDKRFAVTTYTSLNAGGYDRDWHILVDRRGRVGINTNQPLGTLDVNGQIFQRGSVLHGDYVFDDDYELETIEEHSERMWSEKHLPEVPPRQVDEDGQEVLEIGAHRQGILVEVEKAHIYIDQLNQEMKELREEIKELKKQLED